MPELKRSLAACLLGLAGASGALAAGQTIDNVTVTMVAVNGGADTSNPGTTCVKLSSPVAAACTSGWMAVPNNNRSLLAAALTAKQSSANLLVIYDDATPQQHCPYVVFTGCSVNSIVFK